jgi:hypothetical protein
MSGRLPRFGELARHLVYGVIGLIQAFQEPKNSASVRTLEAKKAADELGDLPPLVKVCLAESVEVHKSAHEIASDKNYQSKTILIAWLSFAVAFLTLISLIAYSYITHGQLVEMRNATGAANKAADAAFGQLRPWLDAEIVAVGPIVFDSSGGALVTVSVKVTNVGHSPAVGINVVPDSLNGPSNGGYDQMQEKDCAQFKNDPNPEGWGPALFTGKDFTRSYGVPVPKSEVDKTGTIFNPSIIGSVCYMLGPKGEHHQTNFFYTFIRQVTPDGRTLPLTRGRNVPAGQISFQRLYEIGNGAN